MLNLKESGENQIDFVFEFFFIIYGFLGFVDFRCVENFGGKICDV